MPLENPLRTALAQLERATITGSQAGTEEAEAEARRLLASLRAESLIDRLRNSLATKR